MITRVIILACALTASLAAAPVQKKSQPVQRLPAAPLNQSPQNPYESPGPVAPENQIDKLVFPRLKSIGIEPVLCSDAVFVRRAYLDIIGTLPTAEEARKFIKNPDSKNKRRQLIDQLLERPEFVHYWAMKWGDILRIKAEFPVNLWPNAAQAYHRWVCASIAENKPYDQFARELLTSNGSNFRVGPVNFYRAIQNRTPDGIASSVALTLMGTRTDAWSKEQLDGMAAFFSQVGYKPTREWKEEHIYWDPFGSILAGTNAAVEVSSGVPVSRAPSSAVFPDGRKIKLPSDRDPREVFADWLVRPENPWFARAMANRVWYWLMGRGIIHEPDDIRKDNAPSNPALLVYLEQELVAGDYDLKRLFRMILNSRTYQMSAVPSGKPKEEETFARYPLRRLEAEVLIDSINSITGTTDLYTSAIPEPFTYIPADQPAIALADGSITSPFLTLFGRSARATGMENERINKMMPSQALHLLNSSHIQRKIEQGPKLRAILDAKQTHDETIAQLYLAVLSRFPTAEEVATLKAHGRRNKQGTLYKGREEWTDIAWALINSNEFLHRH